MAYYLPPINCGTRLVTNKGDGYSIGLTWWTAYPTTLGNSIFYQIFFSKDQETIFSEGPKYAALSGNTAEVTGLDIGQTYFFAIRPVEYDPTLYDPSLLLPVATDQTNLRFYPYTTLSAAITATALTIPLDSTIDFPSAGIVKIGAELIQYSSITGNDLNLTSLLQRGFNDTQATYHNLDGYDGYYYRDTTIFEYIPEEIPLLFDRWFPVYTRFDYPNFAYTISDGYHQVTNDILTTNLASSDEFNQSFPRYDYVGWHRTDPVLLFNGQCVGSYIGGYQFCADGYSGVGRVVRGLSFQDMNNQRQEVALEINNDPVSLIKRMNTGIICSCYLNTSEYQDDRCNKCFGSKFVLRI